MMNIKRLIALLFVVCAPGGLRAAKGQSPHKFEQRHFSAEAAGVEEPVSIPNDILDVLRKDEGVRSLLDDQGIPAEKLPVAWFSASLVHLENSSEPDMVVKGGEPIQGANVTTFWVFLATHRGHELVLRAVAHDLLVQNERKNGYLEIQTMSATALKVNTLLFKFDGRRYVQSRSRTEQVR
jgi:hypothetical protein